MDGTEPAAPGRFARILPWLAFAGAAGLGTAFHLHTRFLSDDALITIRYSEHLAAGDGLVYNVGEKVLGTTTPLWALLLAGAAKAGVDPVGAACWIGVLAFGWTSAATVLLFARRGAGVIVQAMAGALVGTSPLLLTWAGAGMETSLYVALVATLLLVFEAQRWATFGFVAGAAALVRPDVGLLLLPAAALVVVRTRSLRPLLRAAPGFAVVVLPWIVGASLYYGSPLPNSGFAKRLQVEDWGTFGGLMMRALWEVGPVLPFALVGAVATGRDVRRALPLAAFACIVLGLHFGNLPGCGWYTPAPMYLVLVLAADGAALLASGLAGAAAPWRSPVALAAPAGPLVGHVLLPREAHDIKLGQATVEKCHARVGDWLRENAPRDWSVAVDNIGYIGYRSGLRVVDMLGLVQPDTARAIAEGHRDHAIRTYRPELVAVWQRHGNTWKYLPDDAWMKAEGYVQVFETRLFDQYAGGPAYVVFARLPLPQR